MGHTHLTDEALLAEAKQRSGEGRDELVNELFARHYERVARWCLRCTGDRESAADLAQDVFLKAHRHLDTFKGTSRFSTWLYVIVRNESLSRQRRSPPPMESDEVLAEVRDEALPLDEAVHRDRRAERLQEFLATTLDQVERTVFALHYGEDVPLNTITRLLRLSNASGAKAYIVSARRKLAKAATRLRARGEAL
jgi:RNA polymerase sigma-70 factor (ECF subfamily)